MSTRVQRWMVAGLCAGVFLGFVGDAYAFFPMGAFDQYQKLQYMRWSWPALNDVNNDGDISGSDEGVEVLVEGGLNGFTEDEQEIVAEAFAVWSSVPTTYVGFHLVGPAGDPIVVGTSIGGTTTDTTTTGVKATTSTTTGTTTGDITISTGINDLVNTVSIETSTDLVTVGVGAGILGMTFITTAVDDTVFSIGDLGFLFSGGQIVEADIVVAADGHRALPGVTPLYDLKATLVHEVGHFIGLAHTPLNNLSVTTLTGQQVLLESPVVAMRDASNILRLVGATPTMFPIAFYLDDGRGAYISGQTDLAPDDIAGVSFLYPRGSQDAFYTISQEARTKTRSGFPSVPLSGGNIVAWCDTDNDPNTARIPLFSTMTGLYEIQPLMGGWFDLNGMYKVLEPPGGGAAFEPTYVLTMNPLNSLDFTRQSPIGYTADTIKSIEGGVSIFPPPIFQSEVFHEKGNLYDIANHDVGTPIRFEQNRLAVVSADTSKTLATMLPGLKPMFGDRNDVCPYNIIITDQGTTTDTTTTTTASIRRFRDEVLLNNPVGTALVDAYYKMSPTLARFLLRHASVLKGAQSMAQVFEWSLSNRLHMCGVLVAVALAAMGMRRRKRVALAAGLLVLVLLAASPAGALIANLSDADMVRISDAVITGKVESVTSQWVTRGSQKSIMTDIAITVTDNVKGRLNKSASIYLRVPGGRVGSIITKATEIPDFFQDEEVVLYLQENADAGYVILAGKRGKFQVTTDTASGKKFVVGADPEAQIGLSGDPATLNDTKAKAATPVASEDGRVPLDAYKEYVRNLVQAQKK